MAKSDLKQDVKDLQTWAMKVSKQIEHLSGAVLALLERQKKDLK